MFEQRWAAQDPEAMGLPGTLADAPVDDILDALSHATAGLGFLEWTRYRAVAELHTRLVVPHERTDRREIDAATTCAARIATVLSISQGAAFGLLFRAVALRDRLPRVSDCLRDGLLAPKHIHTIIARTDLVDGQTYAGEVDAEIAEAVRRRGSFSDNRMRDLIDRVVHRHDPDAVRRRREQAKDGRSFWTENAPDGMATVGASMTAENAILLAAAVDHLAGKVCAKDPRSAGARKSDALFALATHTAFDCQCEDPDCTATGWTGEDGLLTRVVVHVVTDSATMAANAARTGNAAPTDNAGAGPDAAAPTAHSGFLPGYGVISPDHVADLATRDDAVVRPLTPDNPATQPAEPYRPSAALDTFVRIRDQYCTWPGCNAPAWTGDLDHVTEYDHDNPDTGGRTTEVNLNGKCRFHHNLKTHGDFLDDQHRDETTGRVVSTVTTPEGRTVDGPAHNGYDVHPGLADITFDTPDPPDPPDQPPDTPREPPTRRRTRLADKHARRRRERARNKKRREDAALEDPPPF